MFKRVITGVLFVSLFFLCACENESSKSSHPKPVLLMSVEEMYPDMPLEQQLATAAADGDVAGIDRLIALGANPNRKGVYGMTPAFWALYHPNLKGFTRLLQQGADPNLYAENDQSVLHYVVFKSYKLGIDFLKAALKYGGDPNSVSPRDSNISIRYAVFDKEAFTLLYEAGANIEYVWPDGTSFLALCFSLRDYELAYFLFTEGVDFTYKWKKYGNGIVEDTNWILKELVPGYSPDEDKGMWFWRCVDFLEKKGLKFEVPSNVVRPKVLATNPPNILGEQPKRLKKKETILVHEASVVVPTPHWTHSLDTQDDLQMRQTNRPAYYSYEYVPKKESFTNWTKHFHFVGIYVANSSLKNFVSLIKSTYTSTKVLKTIEQDADHLILYIKEGESDIERVVYISHFKNTYFAIEESWRQGSASDSQNLRDVIVQNMKIISADQWLNVTPVKISKKEN